MDESRSLRTPDGTKLSYRLWRGAGANRPTLVLLHGVASNRTRWSEFVEHTALTRRWNLLRPDLRGHGESFARGRLTMELWCADLLHLLEAENVDRALLIGHSLGAQLALHFAARHPARVQGLGLIDPVLREAVRGNLRYLLWLRPLARLAVEIILLLNRLGLRRRNIPNRDLRALDTATRARMLDAGKQEEMIALYSSPWEDLRYFPVASFVQELLELVRPLPSLDARDMPILVLLSKGLTYTDPDITRAWLAALPRSETVTLDAYHWPLTENPVQVREAIERWCARLPE